jgi:hypothetical protein
MPEPTPEAHSESTFQRTRKWAFRTLVAVSVAWGIFSAVVVFAVRYDLLPETAPAGQVGSRGLALDEARDWPTLGESDWRNVLSPDSVMAIAQKDSALVRLLSVDGGDMPTPSVAIQLLWDPATRGAVWVAHVAAPTCNCPYERAERWNYGRLVMHANSGKLLGRYLRPSIDAGELETLARPGAARH